MGKIIDLTGQKIDMWTVVSFVEIKNHKTMWLCKCDCGNEKIVNGDSLRYRRSRNCGCVRKRNCIHDLTGNVYGELTVVGLSDNRDNKHCVWICRCSCGNICFVPSYSLVKGARVSCGCIKSKSEQLIQEYLHTHHIAFQSQKRFVNCKYNRYLPFDFYLPDYNIAIEYDGEQHYYDIDCYKNKYEEIKRRDAIKTKYCEENDIILLRIPYWDKDKIESILSDWLFLYDAEEANSSSVAL